MLARKIACLALIISCIPLYGKNSYIKHESCTFLESEHLHIHKVNNHELVNELVFYLPGSGSWEDMGSAWFDVEGSECSESGDCKAAAHASVQILHIRRKSLSGNFSIEFQDGRKFSGPFDANEKNERKSLFANDRLNRRKIVLTLRDQPGQQRRPLRQFGNQHMLMLRMRAIANTAQAIECRDSKRGGEVAIGATADRSLLQSPA